MVADESHDDRKTKQQLIDELAEFRRQVSNLVREREENFLTLISNISDVLWTTDEDANISFISDNVTNVYGFTPEEIYRGGERLWLDRIHPDDIGQVREAFGLLIEKGTSIDIEYRIRRKDGDWIWLHDRALKTHNDKGKIRVEGIFTDITERKLAEEKLREKQVQLEALVSNVNVIILEGDPYNIYYVGGSVDKILGYPIEKWFADPDGPVGFWSKHLHPDDIDKMRICADAIAKGENHSFEYRMYAADGSIVWFYDTVTVESENGIATKARSVMVDITKRKVAEAKLRLSEERFYKVFHSSPNSIGISRVSDGLIIDVNETFEKMLGISRDTAIGQTSVDLGIWPSSTHRDKVLSQISASGSFRDVECEYRRSSGELFQVSLSGEAIEIGGVACFVTTAQDITERKVADEALRDSERKFNSLVEHSGVGIVVLQDNQRVFFNTRMHEMLGYTHDEYKEIDYLSMIHPDDLSLAIERIQQRLEGVETSPGSIQLRVLTKSGEIRWIESDSVRTLWEGRPALQAFVLDITERKMDSEALSESQERYRRLSEASHEGIGVSEKGEILDANLQLAKMTGYSLQELRGMPVEKLIAPESRELVRQKHASKGEDAYYHLAMKKDGSIFPVEVRGRNIPLDGRVVRVTAIRDLTKQKEAEEELVKSEEKFSKAFRFGPDSFTLTSIETGKIVDCNFGFERTFGYTSEEAIGKTTMDLGIWKNPEDRVQMTAMLEESGEIRDLEVELRTKSNEIISCLVSGALIEIQGESYLLGITRDISDRKKAEEELRGAFFEISRLKDQIEAENIYLREEIQATQLHGGMIGKSKAMKSVMAHAEQVAKTDSTVLILGETGTGKELLARAIHEMSERSTQSLITVNCAAMPSTLVEGELFGREKGAYTGALTKQIGRFEAAHGGTIFLDEIGELQVDTQAKLLRVLESGQFERLGSNESVTVDVRVIAATNRDLEKEISEGKFREDLFYRLNVFPIIVPPLRDHSTDIEELVWTFVEEFGSKMGKRIESISRESMELLVNHKWPGNVRELRNLVERSMILTKGRNLKISLPRDVLVSRKKGQSMQDIEREHISETLEKVGWRIRGRNGAAEILGMKPTTLESRIKKHGIIRTYHTK